MSVLPYKYFVYLNLILGLVLIPGSILLNKGSVDVTVGISIFGLIQVIISLLSKETDIMLPKLVNTRLYTLVIFFLAIILNFLPYILKFTGEKNLLWLVLSCSGISLISILFTNFKFLDSK